MTTPEGSDNPGTPAPTPTPAPAPTPAPVADSGWLSELPADLKSMVETKGYKSPTDLATAYVHAERAIGVDKIAVPKDGQWDPAARQKLGIPDTVEGYKVTRPAMPEGVKYDEGFEKAMLPVVHKLGLTPGQVNGLIEAVSGHRLAEMTSGAAAQKTALAEAQAAMKTEFGAAYDVKIQRAAKAAEHFGLSGILDQSGLGNHPDFIKAFAKIGEALGEDVIKVGTGAAGGMTPEEAKAEANKIMASEEYRSRTHPMHEETVKKVARLFELQFPEAA